MSRFTLPLIVEGQIAHIAYGFDHALGPFVDEYDHADDLIIQHAYLINRSFDCHALALYLTNLVDQQAIPNMPRTALHISRLWLDLPI
jgi:hypothetical protein